jgi:hypothetical protein
VIGIGSQVEHADFGIGKVLAVLGQTATVEFFGEAIDVVLNELVAREPAQPASPAARARVTDTAFRKAFEAVNLGVVPNDPDRLVNLTIGGEPLSAEIGEALASAPKTGLCRVYMGYYGSGKSHHLALVKAIALRDGWVTASVELDPKAADPAKPSSVYQSLIAGLAFPMRFAHRGRAKWERRLSTHCVIQRQHHSISSQGASKLAPAAPRRERGELGKAHPSSAARRSDPPLTETERSPALKPREHV